MKSSWSKKLSQPAIVNLDAEPQKSITVYYDNQIVGEFVADIIVNDTVILELKSMRRIIRAHACRSEAQIPLSGPRVIHVNDSEAYFTGEVQLVNYLVAKGKPVGLILNSWTCQEQVLEKERLMKRAKIRPALARRNKVRLCFSFPN